jgi:hypothetical protein
MNVNNLPSLEMEAGFETAPMADAVTSRGKVIASIITGVVIGLS